MTQPDKSCYSGQYKAEKEYINGGEMEELKFDSDTGTVTCYAEIKRQNEETLKQIKKACNVQLWLAWIAILIGLSLWAGI